MPDPLAAVRKAAEALRSREEATAKARDDLRSRIYEAADAGASRSTIARAAGVSRQWVGNLLERR